MNNVQMGLNVKYLISLKFKIVLTNNNLTMQYGRMRKLYLKLAYNIKRDKQQHGLQKVN